MYLLKAQVIPLHFEHCVDVFLWLVVRLYTIKSTSFLALTVFYCIKEISAFLQAFSYSHFKNRSSYFDHLYSEREKKEETAPSVNNWQPGIPLLPNNRKPRSPPPAGYALKFIFITTNINFSFKEKSFLHQALFLLSENGDVLPPYRLRKLTAKGKNVHLILKLRFLSDISMFRRLFSFIKP